jgi:hypothetical protein
VTTRSAVFAQGLQRLVAGHQRSDMPDAFDRHETLGRVLALLDASAGGH